MRLTERMKRNPQPTTRRPARWAVANLSPAKCWHAPDASPLELMEHAKEVWKGQLVDLGGRNTLLYYRDLKVGTLDLGPDFGANDVRVDELLSSRPVALSDIFGEERRPDAAKRARTIRAKATENFEERGLRTLFLAWGTATRLSQRSSVAPAAPVLGNLEPD